MQELPKHFGFVPNVWRPRGVRLWKTIWRKHGKAGLTKRFSWSGTGRRSLNMFEFKSTWRKTMLSQFVQFWLSCVLWRPMSMEFSSPRATLSGSWNPPFRQVLSLELQDRETGSNNREPGGAFPWMYDSIASWGNFQNAFPIPDSSIHPIFLTISDVARSTKACCPVVASQMRKPMSAWHSSWHATWWHVSFCFLPCLLLGWLKRYLRSSYYALRLRFTASATPVHFFLTTMPIL